MVIVLVIQLLLILSVVFLERKKPEEALLWAIVLTLLPGVGILLYLAFGSTVGIKLTYAYRNRRMTVRYAQLLRAQMEQMETAGPLPGELASRQGVIRFHLRGCNSLLTRHNQMEMLTSGKAKYDRLFAELAEAKESIHIAYYAIHRDSVGKRLAEVLAAKAAEGVKVRVLYDTMGSLLTPTSMFRALKKAGGRVHRIKPTLSHFRNHRKIVVIDGRIGYTGGMNIGEKYLGLNPKKSPWRDTQLRIRGEAVRLLQYYFLYDWLYACKRGMSGIEEAEFARLFPQTGVEDALMCQVVSGGVDTYRANMKLSMVRLITAARERIVLQSPYLVPSDSVLEALQVAAASGVDIRLMLPAQRSSFFLEPATKYYIEQLLPYGIRVFLYDGYVHAKTMAIDGDITCIGSVNMDIRSLEIDDEVQVIVYDEGFAARHAAVLAEDFARCREMDYAAFAGRGLWQRMKERLFQLFSPLM